MKIINFIALFLVFSFISCEKEPEVQLSTNHLIVGSWIQGISEGSVIVMVKATGFVSDKPGMQFNQDGTLIKRMNAGMCGTPPIVYANYNGTWNQKNDSIVEISNEYWGGVNEYSIKVLELNQDQMIYTYVDVNY